MKIDIKTSIWGNENKPKLCGIVREKSWGEKLFLPSLILGSCYIIWRLFYTIDDSTAANIVAGYLLWIAELYSFLMFLSFAYITKQKCDCDCDYVEIDESSLEIENAVCEIENMLCSLDSSTNTISCTCQNYPSVDIFICTYNEGMDILLDTFEGCNNIDYPNKEVYVLDDGRRDNVKNVANEYGFKYITRDNNAGYKAGNINNALKQTHGELIVIFDADHIPVKNFLNELVDFFQDKEVAIVQTPQHFYNPDPIQKNLKMYKTLSNEQDLFFRILEPSISCSNSTLVAGTNFMIRRQFLEDIGGLPHESITEDMALGIKLQEKGLKVYFHNKPLAAGLAPENYKEYVIQRSRWAKGTIQIFLNKKMQKYLNNLSLKQRVPYYAGLLYYMLSLPRLICTLAPIVFLIFAIKPVVADFWPTLFLFQLSYFSLKIIHFCLSSRKYRNIIFSDLYELCIWYPLISEMCKMFLIPQGIKKQKFTVTNKGLLASNEKVVLSTILPNLILFILCFVSYFFVYQTYNKIDYKPALYINLFWNTYNVIMLGLAIAVGFEKEDRRNDYRIMTAINISIKEYPEIRAKIINISKTGVQIITEKLINLDFITIDLPEIKGLAMKNIYSKEKDGLYYSGLSFVNTSEESKKEIFQVMFKDSKNW